MENKIIEMPEKLTDLSMHNIYQLDLNRLREIIDFAFKEGRLIAIGKGYQEGDAMSIHIGCGNSTKDKLLLFYYFPLTHKKRRWQRTFKLFKGHVINRIKKHVERKEVTSCFELF